MTGGLGGAARTAGRALTGIGTAAGFAFTAGVESAVKFQDELATINTVARLPEERLQGIGDEIQQLSRETGKTTTDLTSAFYDMVSAGIDAEDAMGVLASGTSLAIGGLGSTAESTDLLTTALNSYQLGAGEAARVSDIFAIAVEKGKVTIAEIGSSLSDVAPLAASAGIELEEISAAYSTLTASGVPAGEAMTQMRSAITALISPNESLNKIQEQTGINFADLAEQEGLHVALAKLAEVTGHNEEALGRLSQVSEDEFPSALAAMQDELGLTNSEVERFTKIAGEDGAAAAISELAKEVGSGDSAFAMALGRVQAYQFALLSGGENAGVYAENLSAAYNSAGTAAEQAAIKMDSPLEAGRRLAAQAATFLQDVGQPFADSVGPFVFALNQMGMLMGGLITPARLLGSMLGMLGAGFVKLGAMAVASLVSMIAPAWAVMAPFLPIIAIVAAVVAAVALLYLAWENNFLGIRDIAETVWNAVAGFVGGAIDWIVGIVSDFMGFISLIWTGVEAAASFVWGLVGGHVQGAADVIGGAIGFVVDVVSAVWDGVSGAARAAWRAVSRVVEGAVEGITGFIDGIADVARGVWETVSGIFGAIGDAAAAVSNFINDPVGSVGSFLGSFQTGAWDLPRDGMAYVHKGEMIVPPEVAEGMRRMLRSGGGSFGPGGLVSGDVSLLVEHALTPEAARLLAGAGADPRAIAGALANHRLVDTLEFEAAY